jgi:alcohol dehydrogenase
MSRVYFEFFCPVKILAGTAALEHMPFELRHFGASRPMLVTDAGVRKAGLLAPVERAMEEGDMRFAATFDEVPPDSSTRVVADVARLYRERGCDAIVAVGGGSVIDTSKGANILVSEGGDSLEPYAGAGALKRPLKPFFVVPTTSGTGSEVTLAAVIADVDKGVKLPFTSHFLLPNAAVLDPRMTLTLPPFLTAATAMDALTHAVEAYTCMGKNAVSDAYAVAAVKKVAEHLPRVMTAPDDLVGRFELAQAATLAGIAFSNSMTGLVHALGHAIGALCHVHHGACMGLLLPYVLEHNAKGDAATAEAIGELLLPLEGADFFARTPRGERAAAAIASIRRLRDRLHTQCGFPRTLTETGKVAQGQLPTLARKALDEGPLAYNPVAVGYDEALDVLEKAFR